MIWTKTLLKDYILSAVKDKSTLSANDGNVSNNMNNLIEFISKNICEHHSQWQKEVTINGIIFNGGLCADGVFIGPAFGNSSFISFSKFLSQSILFDNMIQSIPNSYFEELTSSMKSFLSAITTGFVMTYNDWLQTLIFSNIILPIGVTTTTILTPVGVFTGIASTSDLVSCIPLKLTKQLFLDNIKQNIQNELKLADSTEISSPMNDMINSIVDGILTLQTEWLTNTKLQNLQVTGASIYLSPLVGAIGSGGILV